jgi:tartrate dehydrogenase/decarboxylase/D-malate dehydrogenase
MKTYQIASIPGDGIGKEVIPEGEKVLAAISKRFSEIAFHFERFDWGGDFY